MSPAPPYEQYSELFWYVYPDEPAARAGWLSGSPRADRASRRLCLQILKGVAYLHDVLGVAHRDIKTGNLVG